MAVPGAFLTSKDQLWTTPWPVVRALETMLEIRFTLDVCASRLSSKATWFYDEAVDAFKQDWAKDAGKKGAAWCNPPYGPYAGHVCEDWVRYGWEQSLRGLTIAYLLPTNKQDQAWWHVLVEKFAESIPASGRIHFIDAKTGKRPITWSEKRERYVVDGNSHGSVFAVFGPDFRPRAPRRTFIVPECEETRPDLKAFADKNPMGSARALSS